MARPYILLGIGGGPGATPGYWRVQAHASRRLPPPFIDYHFDDWIPRQALQQPFYGLSGRGCTLEDFLGVRHVIVLLLLDVDLGHTSQYSRCLGESRG